jgi:hypothetical protein
MGVRDVGGAWLSRPTRLARTAPRAAARSVKRSMLWRGGSRTHGARSKHRLLAPCRTRSAEAPPALPHRPLALAAPTHRSCGRDVPEGEEGVARQDEQCGQHNGPRHPGERRRHEPAGGGADCEAEEEGWEWQRARGAGRAAGERTPCECLGSGGNHQWRSALAEPANGLLAALRGQSSVRERCQTCMCCVCALGGYRWLHGCVLVGRVRGLARVTCGRGTCPWVWKGRQLPGLRGQVGSHGHHSCVHPQLWPRSCVPLSEREQNRSACPPKIKAM